MSNANHDPVTMNVQCISFFLIFQYFGLLYAIKIQKMERLHETVQGYIFVHVCDVISEIRHGLIYICISKYFVGCS